MKILNLRYIILISSIILCVSLFLQLSIGAFSIPINKILYGIFNYDLLFNTSFLPRHIFGDSICNFFNIELFNSSLVTTDSLVIWNIRIPRFIVGICVGINLACSGVIFQTLTKNEMASPYILGISQGSGLSIILILILFPSLYSFIPILSMIGGIIAFLIIYLIAWNQGTSPIRLVLSGIVIGSICTAIQTALFFFTDDLSIMQNAISWTTGSLIGSDWQQVRMILPSTLLMMFLCLLFKRPLNLMLLGDNNAKALGVATEFWRFALASVGILGAASSVGVGGLIGFVGLVAPHIARSLVGNSHKQLFIANFFIGSSLLCFSDTLARILFMPIQIPVGLIMSIIGGIFFLFLMRNKKEIGKI